MAACVSLMQMLEAGVHFGHQTRRWNPKMAPYIFTDRNGIYIIDLQKTVRKVDEAYNFVKRLSLEGESVLFVGTKKQAQEAVREEAERCGMFYVNKRWLGGMLTNFQTIRRRVDRLHELEKKDKKYAPEGHQKRLDAILAHWNDILQIISEELPDYGQVEQFMRKHGMPVSPAELGHSDAEVRDAFTATKDIRDKYNSSRLLWDLGLLDEVRECL